MTRATKPRQPPTVDQIFSAQLAAGALAMTMLGRLLKAPRPSDPEWVAQTNKLAEQVAALARIALDTRPPREYAPRPSDVA